ncbi:MAG: dihydrofolate reductase family protein [Nocardioides sp.]|nr:dihydrofolate reductase family protein [Nocardioides sp.]
MRVLVGAGDRVGRELADDDLDELMAPLRTPWLRVNMVATVDGAASGASGLSGGINNAADKRVFDSLRRVCDAVGGGAGTARAEGYRVVDKPLVVVSRRGEVPDRLRYAKPGLVHLATCASAEHLAESRALLGSEFVHVVGREAVDLATLRTRLSGLGLRHLLCEGGPHLLRDLLAQGVVDELNCTVVPRLLAGEAARITAGPPVDVPLELHLLLEDTGTLLARWLV